MLDKVHISYKNANFENQFFILYKKNPYSKTSQSDNSLLSLVSVKDLKEALKKEKFFGLLEQINGYPLLKIQEEIFSIFSKNQFVCTDFFTFFMIETSLFDEKKSVLEFLNYYFSTKELLKDSKAEIITLEDIKNNPLDKEKEKKLYECINKILTYPIEIPFKIEDTYFEGDLTVYEFVKRKKAQQKQKERSCADQITLKELLQKLEKTKGYYTLEDTISNVLISDIDLYIRLSLPDTINTYKNLYTFLLVITSSLDTYQTIENFCEKYKKELALEKISKAEIITGKKALLWLNNPDKKQTLEWLLQYINLFFLSIPISFFSLSDFLKDFNEDQKELPISYLVQLKKIEISKKYETIPLYEIKKAYDEKKGQIQGIPFEEINQYIQSRLQKKDISLTLDELMQKEIYYISSESTLLTFVDSYIKTKEIEKKINADETLMEKIISTFKEAPTDSFIKQIDLYFSFRLKTAGIGSYPDFSLFLNGIKKDGKDSIKIFIEKYIDHLFSKTIDFSSKNLQPMIRETFKIHEQYYSPPVILETNNKAPVYKMKAQIGK